MPRVSLGLVGFHPAEALEDHLLTRFTPFPDRLLPVEDPADPSLQFGCRRRVDSGFVYSGYSSGKPAERKR